MARGTVNIQQLTANSGTSYAGTAIDGTNGLLIPAGGVTRNLMLRFTNTGGTIGTVLINPGAYPPAFRKTGGTASPAGSLLVIVAATTGEQWVGIESARYAQADGSIYLDFTPTTMAGSCYAYRLPPDI